MHILKGKNVLDFLSYLRKQELIYSFWIFECYLKKIIIIIIILSSFKKHLKGNIFKRFFSESFGNNNEKSFFILNWRIVWNQVRIQILDRVWGSYMCFSRQNAKTRNRFFRAFSLLDLLFLCSWTTLQILTKIKDNETRKTISLFFYILFSLFSYLSVSFCFFSSLLFFPFSSCPLLERISNGLAPLFFFLSTRPNLDFFGPVSSPPLGNKTLFSTSFVEMKPGGKTNVLLTHIYFVSIFTYAF